MPVSAQGTEEVDVLPHADLPGELLDARPIRAVPDKDELHVVVKIPQDVEGPDGLAEALVLLDRPEPKEQRDRSPRPRADPPT